MNAFAAIAWREVRRAWSSGGLTMPVVFFLLVAILFPFAIGPDPKLLSRIGGGVIWAAALLAAAAVFIAGTVTLVVTSRLR